MLNSRITALPLAARFRALSSGARAVLFFLLAAVCIWIGGFAAVSLLILSLVFLALEGRKADSLGLWFSAKRLAEFAGGFALGMILLAAQCGLYLSVSDFHWERNTNAGVGMLFSGALFYLGSAASEELAFRGYGFQRLVEALGTVPAQFLVAVLFALYHVALGLPLLPSLLFTGVGSVFYGFAFLRTGGVALPIGLHAGWNFLQENLVGVSGRNQAGYWKPVRSPGAADISFSASFGFFLLVTMLGWVTIYFFTRSRQNQSSTK